MPNKVFKLKSEYKPDGDQPKAIKDLLEGLKKGFRKQTLLGATGTGKTFTIANVIEEWGKPTLVIAHNKTLAAQLAQEFREFFPDAAVHYFVSYYDYYQPEAYMPVTDTYIEKDAQINKEIDRLRHATTQSLLTRPDVIIVASVSCIYGLGSPEEYEKVNLKLEIGSKISRTDIMRKLLGVHFERTNSDLTPGTFRSIGDRVEVMPISETFIYQIEFAGGAISKILKVDPVSAHVLKEEQGIFLFPAKHFITETEKVKVALKNIKLELTQQLKKFEKEGKLLEAERIKRRTNYDLAMIKEVGYCSGIENYSRQLSGKKEGEAPDTLLSYFKSDFLTIIDESHVTLPQLGGMYAGDASRKKTLVDFGFRLPSAKDNRPLKYNEFEERIGDVIYVSATPSETERTTSAQVVEQIIRPTGLIDPEILVRPVSVMGSLRSDLGANSKELKTLGPTYGPYPGQIEDFVQEADRVIKKGFRAIATTLTKKMAEDLTLFLKEKGFKAEYLHSDIKTIERIQILSSFRRGDFDILIGVNLLREGLDLPELALIGILDADKEGFLRSETSLIQIIGRAARNVEGRVVLYADHMTKALESAIGETNRRRDIQIAYNKKHGITPKTIIKNIKDITEELENKHEKAVNVELDLDVELFKKTFVTSKSNKGKGERESIKNLLLSDEDRNKSIYEKIIKIKEKEMNKAVKELDFETAAILRDEIIVLNDKFLGK
ncbi:TPA: excinuclease ABC subunit B [Candidatus Nomurabacteria bacterium]|nr:MAG: UvrABC system protein B [Candidatus Nomurabacteria bacterium GW2011_GWE2_36_115]KKP93422.1 MAG: UvrABC system protein B [Candidatus Nomurabacteria bacterium GW2011_GWF2_36_126]KKP96540.1 MAG: UvrABC system protein B [Candidatus Nomurabacteria bacterium GW2011_GWD2_36_14]KKP99856.1 MAG: UvrABC system protein B [Candidatus Nomurabacteria bacterium GW2011_GWF2_36_19]KKQ05105.1 MAG: UvrABC system protein B [Candidatus Nomurabacteria bacterium GW2011_GWF1_36_47]KKQ09240.1 MAG: UvrABC system